MARKVVTPLRHRVEFALFRMAERLLSSFPLATVQTFGRGLGLLFYLVDGRHRRVVRDNLRGADLAPVWVGNEAAIRTLTRGCFQHFGELFLSAIPLMGMDEEELDRHVKVEGLEHFDAAKATGRGFIQLTGHYGNWEAVALSQSRHGRALAVIAREIGNPLLQPELDRFRTRFGNEVINKDGAVRETVKALRAGKGVGFLLDQDALTMGVWVRFLGRWAATFPTAGAMAVRFRLPILPVFSWPNGDGTITVRFEPPFEAPLTGDPERDAWMATQIMTSRIEAQIRKDPRWWFWLHRRFKTQPDTPGSPPLPSRDWVESFLALGT
jgi:KDO2-lipid IV(A) lauroyltransferase